MRGCDGVGLRLWSLGLGLLLASSAVLLLHSLKDAPPSLKRVSPLSASAWSGPERRVVQLAERNVSLVLDPLLHVYRVEGRPVVWAFWGGGPMPAFVRLALASLVCANSGRLHVELLSASSIHAWVDHVHPAFELLRPEHQADYFRARVLDEFGGAYVDADSIGLASLFSLFKKLRWYDLVNISWPADGDPISITTMGPMRARNSFTSAWVTDLHLLLDMKMEALLAHQSFPKTKNYPIAWSEMLRGLVLPVLRQLLQEKSLRYFSLNGPTSFGQLVAVPWVDPEAAGSAAFTFVDTELLMFHNSQLGPQSRALSLGGAAASPSLLGALLRLAFRRCRASEGTPEGPGRGAFSVRPNSSLDADLLAWIPLYARGVVPLPERRSRQL